MIQVTLSAYKHNTVSQVNLLLFLDIKWLRHICRSWHLVQV